MSKRQFSFISNSLSKGQFIGAFFKTCLFQGKRSLSESKEILSDYFGVIERHIFFFGAGRMSVYTVLKSLQLTSSDEVVVAGYTCVVLTNAVKFAGCKVRYVDVDEETLNLNKDQLFAAISEDTKAVIVPHNFGLAFEDIKEIKSRHPEIIIIEDVAHSFGSKNQLGEFCGTIGDVGFFSLEYSKPLTTGLGGILFVNNESLLERVDLEYNALGITLKGTALKMIFTLGALNMWYFLSTTFFQRMAMKVLQILRLNYKTSAQEISGELPAGYPVRMHPMLGSLLVLQLRQLDKINKKKQEIVLEYESIFSSFNTLRSYPVQNQVMVRYPIVFSDAVSDETIEKVKEEAIRRGIQFGFWFNDVVHPRGSFRYCYSSGDCPSGEKISQRILNLPVNIHARLSRDTLNEISELFNSHGVH